jgi:hypothetical protein
MLITGYKFTIIREFGIKFISFSRCIDTEILTI